MLEYDTILNYLIIIVWAITTRIIVCLAYLIYGNSICFCYDVVGVTSFLCLLYAVLEVIDH